MVGESSQDVCPIAYVLQTGEPMWLPLAGLKSRSGDWLMVELTCTPLVDEGASGVVLSFRDLTTQIQMEEDLHRLASIPKESPFPIVEFDIQANMLYANPSMTRLMEQAGFCEDGFSAAVPTDVQTIVERCLTLGVSEHEVEVDVGRKQYAWLFCPLKDLQLVRGYGIDVTERKLAADELGVFVEVLGQHVQDVLKQDMRIEVNDFDIQSPGFDLREIQNIINNRQEPFSGFLNRLGIFALLGSQGTICQQRRHTNNPI